MGGATGTKAGPLQLTESDSFEGETTHSKQLKPGRQTAEVLLSAILAPVGGLGATRGGSVRRFGSSFLGWSTWRPSRKVLDLVIHGFMCEAPVRAILPQELEESKVTLDMTRFCTQHRDAPPGIRGAPPSRPAHPFERLPSRVSQPIRVFRDG